MKEKNRKENEKNDANDAEAICEAVSRPKTRFVAIKSAEQQAALSITSILFSNL